ncbi:conjugal transfer protein TraG N-terminal domain-containing protein [Xenorhabdus sp. KJ12.1]|uniref:conjugal transfer protein TraG N-terminal domain-containing protein n=1 Tax=Xenorhabdus sp. KJ12.1 TaxID=1851571 RepID=UPI000C04BC93|nr:conjugal transfer protein TraG N-terminal domain-containing protein [Xenorhabdus sp. KJ12.1]PHM72216.1 conjugal transfer protein TraG [Xenorhabdus sp. KJ12.1]
MSEWNIYTVGSVDFLYNVFNAIAMMLNNGTYSDTFRISALLGVIGIVIASAVSGGKTLSFGQMAVCVVMYMLFFQVPARVNLEDSTTGEYRAVDNVPWGIAAPASIISTVGYSITEFMEQAFSTPAMTKYGALDPLFTLSAYYDTMKDPMRWMMGNEKNNSDIAASIDSYIRTCVINDITRNANTYSNIWRSRSGIDALASSDLSTYAVLHDGKNSNGPKINPKYASQYTCAEAFTKLKNQAHDSYSTITSDYGRILSVQGRCKACSPKDKVIEMMNFYNLSSTDIRDFQLQMMMMPHIIKIPVNAQLDAFKGNAAIARTQTQTQQAFQWTSGGSSFLYWMSSFMPIFQGVVYALTPFMAFLLGLGIMGLRLITKYFLIIVWTQTWVPLAAIINLYMLTKMQTDATAIMSIGYEGIQRLSTVPAFNQMYDLLVSTQKNIALAGNLFSLIPALGGFIVWGSAVAFNSLANSAAAPAPADTKVLSPDMTNAPALNNRSAEFSHTPLGGTTITGASSVVGGISMQEMASANLSSAQSRKESATAQESAARNSFVNALATNKESGSNASAQNAIVATALQQAFGSDASKIYSFAEKHGLDATDAVAKLNSLAGNASIGPSTPVGSVSVSATTATTDQHGKSINTGESSVDTDAARLTDSLGANYEQKLQGAINNIASKSGELGISSSNGTSYSSAYNELQTAEKQYSEAEIFSQSSAVNQEMKFDVLGKTVTDSPGLEEKMQQMINGVPGASEKRNTYANLMAKNGLHYREALGAASVLALKDAGKLNEIAPELGFINGGSSPEITSTVASTNQNIAPDASNVNRNINNLKHETIKGVSKNTGDAESMVSTYKSITNAKKMSAKVEGVFDNLIDPNGKIISDHNKQKEVVQTQQQESAYNAIANLTPSSPIREGLGFVNSLTSRISNDNPVIQETRRQAGEVAFKYGNNSTGSIAIAEYYALGKAGAAGEDLNAARDNAVAAVALETGGYQSADGKVHGGNYEWAERAVTAIESTFERQGSDDSNILSTVTMGLNQAAGKHLPSNTAIHSSEESISAPRSNSSSPETVNNGANRSDGVEGNHEPIVIEITSGNPGPNSHRRKF